MIRNVKAGVRCVVAAAVLLLAIPAAHLAAQTHGSAVLSGVVIDPDGKPVANASVTYQSGGGTAPHAIRTDDRGRFSVMNCGPIITMCALPRKGFFPSGRRMSLFGRENRER